MSKLDELIAELCPNGVEYKTVEEIVDLIMGTSPNGATISESSQNAIEFHQGKTYFGNMFLQHSNAYTTAPKKIAPVGSIIMSVRAPVGDSNITDREIAIGRGLCSMKGKKGLDTKFLYYFINSYIQEIKKKSNGSTFESINTNDVKSISIPLPPLPVQHEIVRILDNFTEFTAELTAELTAERTARKQQYEYYREYLITNANCKVEKLEDIADIYLGLTYTPTYVESGVKFISAQNTSSDYLNLSNVKYISEDEYNKSTSNAKPKREDILFTRVGSNLGHPVIVDTDERLCIFVSLGYLTIKDERVKNTYIKHWMNTDLFWAQVRKNVHGAAKVNLNTVWLKEFEVLIPSSEAQTQIVAILDRFEKLYNDILEKLSVEIEDRQKQYEYYRDKLLTFKKIES